ncbi:hypothetical protein BGZ95_000584 [Linnemannia exigua]|uniref:Uncharacterized protein n=1 Tax=Linnemannia exigua TaxID=604196 RepID=A0AAD4H4B9_9FUNG|nr:hypothetical protein BGZ95_000584 [Linnemannia exigua]
MLEVDTQSRYYPPSPYRTPTWSPESTSNQQADVAFQQELVGCNQQEEGRSINPTSTENSLLSPLSLLSAVASVVGNRIGSPGLSNLDDLATYESLRSLSAATPATNPPLKSSMATVQDIAMTYVHREQGHVPPLTPMLPQDTASLPSMTTTLPTRLSAEATGFVPQIASPATIPRKRGRPPKNSNAVPYSPADSGRWTKLSAIAPRPLQDGGSQITPRQRSDTPCSTSSSSSFRQPTFENRVIMPMGNTVATSAQTANGHGQPAMNNKVRVTPPPAPRLKHNRKPNPDGAIWSVAELAAETSAERRPARAIVYADENIKKLVEGSRVCIMEPCFRTPVRSDLYCLGRPDDEIGHKHENGGVCIDEKWDCRIVLAFRYRYQLKLDVTYLAWVSTIDMATIPVSVLRDFSANREAMRQALEGEERMSEQYRLLSDTGYFTPRKEDKRSQDNNPSVTLDGWSIAHQNEVLMASMSNRLGFLQWVAQAYQMARDSSACPVDTKKEPCDNTIKEEFHLAISKRMKLET